MDKNTITGMVLIFIVLIVFSYLSRPSQEQLAAQQHYYDSIAQVEKRAAELQAKAEAALANEREMASKDSTSLFFNATQGTEQLVSIENNLAKLTLSTKGGSLYSATLKDYMSQDKVTPVTLFEGQEVSLNYLLYNSKGVMETSDYYFTPVNQSENAVTMRLQADASSYVDFTYDMRPDTYLVDLTIQAVGMNGKLASTNNHIDIEWKQKARQIEKGYTYENRLAQLTYKTDDDVEEMSATGDDSEDVKETVTWVAFKNQFFSAVMISDAGFNDTKLNSKMEERNSGYIKDYAADMNTAFDPSGNVPTEMHFYFGPNHYKILSALDDGREKDWDMQRLVYLGWPVIRWINQFFTINVFDWLSKLGLGMGIVLLLMTLIVKIVILPTTWKTYMSSAKMKALKPKVDEINAKYPNEADAMKKQQEIMTMYSQYRVSPMGGCLPMIIQFPILMALFMFVPSAIELRQQSFLWADDLSTYDAFVTFPFNIPFLGDHLSLFCVLMCITNLLYMMYNMKMQDTGANPSMAAMKYMNYIMPVVFLFILNDYPSGLNYYYFLSTLISVATMAWMRYSTDDAKLLAQLEANKKDPKEMRKSGFQARLEAMQKQQEELQRQRNNKH
ncbi:MAG: membrane protein insertase YidC [Bacteroidaceae bacterium]|nr:membrane protein insertase YidC [Bacteroidaceae bacterium]